MEKMVDKDIKELFKEKDRFFVMPGSIGLEGIERNCIHVVITDDMYTANMDVKQMIKVLKEIVDTTCE